MAITPATQQHRSEAPTSRTMLRVFLVLNAQGRWTLSGSGGANEAEFVDSAHGTLQADTTVTGTQRLALGGRNQLLIYET